MKARKFLSASATALSLSVGGVAFAQSHKAAPSTATRPNLIVILADDLGYGDVSAYGQQRFKTPNIDALAKCGMRFTDAYAGAPVCAPSRAALLTGQDSGHAPIRGNQSLGDDTDEGEKGDLPLPAGTQTIATTLKAVGYRTGVFGKWGLGFRDSEGAPWRHGFDSFYGYLDHRQAHNYYPTHLWRNGERAPLANPFFVPHPGIGRTSSGPEDFRRYIGKDYAPYRVIGEAEQFIASNKERPFFLYFAPTLPHAALQTPEAALRPFAGRWPETPTDGEGYSPHPTPRAARAAMIAELDAEVGRIMEKVRQSGLSQKTLIIFTSDNGPSDEGGADLAFFNSAGGLRGFKRDLYEGGIRAPFIACWPGRVPAGRSDATPVAAWDLLPTFAELAGAHPPARINGVSIAPVLLGVGRLPQRSLYWESHEHLNGQAVRIGPWKGVRLQPKGGDPKAPVELYDLAVDPAETRDVAREHPDIVAAIVKVMNARTRSAIPAFNF